MHSIFKKSEKNLEYFNIWQKGQSSKTTPYEKLEKHYKDLHKFSPQEKLIFLESRLLEYIEKKKDTLLFTHHANIERIRFEIDSLSEFASPYTGISEKYKYMEDLGLGVTLTLNTFSKLIPLFNKAFDNAPDTNMLRALKVLSSSSKKADQISAHEYFGIKESDEQHALTALEIMMVKTHDATMTNIKVLPTLIDMLKSGIAANNIKRCCKILHIRHPKDLDDSDISAIKLLLQQDPEQLKIIESIAKRHQDNSLNKPINLNERSAIEYSIGAEAALAGLRTQTIANPFILRSDKPYEIIGALITGIKAGYTDMRGITLRSDTDIDPELIKTYTIHKRLTDYIYLLNLTTIQITERKILTYSNGNLFGHLDLIPLMMLNFVSVPDKLLLSRIAEEAKRKSLQNKSFYNLIKKYHRRLSLSEGKSEDEIESLRRLAAIDIDKEDITYLQKTLVILKASFMQQGAGPVVALIEDLLKNNQAEGIDDKTRKLFKDLKQIVISHKLRFTLDNILIYANVIGYQELKEKLRNLPPHDSSEDYIDTLRSIVRECRYLVGSSNSSEPPEDYPLYVEQKISTTNTQEKSISEEELLNLRSKLEGLAATFKVKQPAASNNPAAMFSPDKDSYYEYKTDSKAACDETITSISAK